MNMETLQQILIVAGTSFASAFVAWFFSRRENNAKARKAEADAKTTEIDNFSKESEVWQDLIGDLRREMAELRKENSSLKKAVQKLERALQKISKCPNYETCPLRTQDDESN